MAGGEELPIIDGKVVEEGRSPGRGGSHFFVTAVAVTGQFEERNG